MPKSVANYLNDLFVNKAGVPADNDALKELLTNADLAKIMVRDDLMSVADAGLYNLEGAKAKLKTELKNTHTKEALNGVDAEIESIIGENEFDDATKALLKSEASTFKRVKLLATEIKKLEAAKAGAGKGEKGELQAEINALKSKQSQIATDYENKLKQAQDGFTEERNQLQIENMLSRYNYALGEIDPEIKIMTAKGVFEKALSASGAKIISDPVNPKVLKLVAQDGTDYYDKSNKKIELKPFLEGSISSILKTKSDDTDDGKTETIRTDGGKEVKVNQSALSQIEAQIQQAS